MSQEAAGRVLPATSGTRAIKPGCAFIAGKVTAVRSYKNREKQQRFASLIVMPAADEFSSPQRVEVHSAERLGEVDAFVSVVVRVRGSVIPFTYTDKTTGELRSSHEAKVQFSAED